MNMKRLMLLVAALVVAASASAQSRLVECKMESKLLGTEKEYSIYLPDGYDKSDRSYPVLYLLHVAHVGQRKAHYRRCDQGGSFVADGDRDARRFGRG